MHPLYDVQKWQAINLLLKLLKPTVARKSTLSHIHAKQKYSNQILFGVTSINVRTHTLMLTYQMSKKWNKTKNMQSRHREKAIERTKWTGTVVGLCGQWIKLKGGPRWYSDTLRSDLRMLFCLTCFYLL